MNRRTLTGFYQVLILVVDDKFIHKFGIVTAEGDHLNIEEL